jgi:hypothetical protein
MDMYVQTTNIIGAYSLKYLELLKDEESVIKEKFLGKDTAFSKTSLW